MCRRTSARMEVYEKAEPPYSGLNDEDEETCACTRSRWCGGRAFADEHRLAGVPTWRAATLVFSLMCIASAIDVDADASASASPPVRTRTIVELRAKRPMCEATTAARTRSAYGWM